MALEKLGVEAVIKGLSSFMSGMNKMDKSIDDVGKSSEKTGKISDKLAQNWAGLATAAASLGAAVFAAKKYFDFAEEGAQLLRLEQSGESLARSFGMSMNEIVDAVDKAASGTVARSDIIQAANRAMLLGVATSAEQMAQLMEVASVRGKAMGLSTTQAFNDIVTGIGRASPMILDNLGIVTGGEKVYIEFAESIGKAKDELTDAEKKQALLNAVLESSEGLLKAAASQAEDLATKYERFNASTKNLSDTFKKELALSVTNIIPDFDDLVDTYSKVIAIQDEFDVRRPLFRSHFVKDGEVIAKTDAELIKWAESQREAAKAIEKTVRIMEEEAGLHREIAYGLEQVTEDTEDLTEAKKKQEEIERRLQDAINQEYKDLQTLMGLDITGMYENMQRQLENVNEQESDLHERMEDVNKEIRNYRIEIQEIKDEEGPLTEEQKNRIAEYNEKIVEAQEKLGGLQVELGKIPDAIKEVEEAWDKQTKKMIFDLVSQRLAMGGLSSEELAALGKLAGPGGFGLIDESTQTLIEGLALATDAMDEGRISGDELVDVAMAIQDAFLNAKTEVNAFGNEVLNLPSEVVLSLTYDLSDIPVLRGKQLLRQYGGDVQRGLPYLVGEKGPELFIPDISGNILSNMMTKAMGQVSSSVTNTNTSYGDNLNLHIHTSAPSENVVADFRMLKAMGSRV